MASVVRPRHDAAPVCGGTGRTAHSGVGGAVLLHHPIVRARHPTPVVRAGPRRCGRTHHSSGRLPGRRDRRQDGSGRTRLLDHPGLLRATRAAFGDGSLFHFRGPPGVVAHHRGFLGTPAHRDRRVLTGFGVGQGKEGRPGENQGGSREGRIGTDVRSLWTKEERSGRRHVPTAGPHPRVLSEVVHHRPVGLSGGPRRVLCAGGGIPVAGCRVALSQSGGRAGGDGRDRADVHRSRRPLDDDRVSGGCVRRHVLHGVQLFRWMAQNSWRVLQEHLQDDGGSLWNQPGGSHSRAPPEVVLGVQHLSDHDAL